MMDILDTGIASEYEKIEVPQWRRHFDLYALYDRDRASPEGRPAYSRKDTEGRSFLATLYYSRLGLVANVQRAVSSKEHRILYIGAIPDR